MFYNIAMIVPNRVSETLGDIPKLGHEQRENSEMYDNADHDKGIPYYA